MKILHVIPSIASVHGGPSRAVLMMEAALARRGVDVDIAATLGPEYRESEREEAKGKHHLFPRLTGFYKSSPSMAYWLWQHVADYDAVHIHALFSFSSTVAAWAARARGVPYVVRPLGTLAHYGVAKRRPLLKRMSLALIEGPILRHAAAVHFTAESEREEARSLGVSCNGVVVPLGIEAEHAVAANVLHTHFPQCIGKRLVLFLSRLDPKKNLEGLLRAFASVAQAFPDVMLVVAGSGNGAYEAGLHQLADELSLGDRVCWTGHVEGELKSSLLGAASLFVLPSYSENFGIAAVEALMAGLPSVLGEGVAVATEVRNAGAGITTGTDAVGIAAAITTLLTQDAVRDEMKHQAIALAQSRYSAAAMADALITLYSTIIDSKRLSSLPH